MRRDAFKKIPGILARYRRHHAWRKVVRVMACVVVFCTTYALILPAITLEKKPACGMEEHTHTEECYAQITSVEKTVPICTLESLNLHRHTEDCQDGSCGYADFVAHTHDERCYDENGQLWCPIQEREAHTHTESCYALPEGHTHGEGCYRKEKGELTCTIPEGEIPHTHSKEAGCYEEVRELTCGLEERASPLPTGTEESEGHTHGDACKDENGELTCALEEAEGHKHGDGCYTTVEKLTCALSDQPHQHTDECYAWEDVLNCAASTEQPVLICEKEEIQLHEHTEECFETDEEGNTYLICGKVQILEHVHTDACFETEGEKVDTKSRTCGMKEGEGAHAHMESCYDEEKNLICGQGHKHTSLCYGEWMLTCGKEEHTHTPECMVDVETEEEWEKTLPETLSDNWREDLLAVAESQLNYAEARPDFQLGEDPRRWSRYGEWYGQPDGEWNTLFVMFCLRYAGIPEEAVPRDSDPAAWVEKLAGRAEGFEKYRLYYCDEDYTPRPGDLVFLGEEGDEAADRVGIVTKVGSGLARSSENDMSLRTSPQTGVVTEGNASGAIPSMNGTTVDPSVGSGLARSSSAEQATVLLETIEGDVSGVVAERTYPMDGLRILGYAALPEKPVEKPVEPVLICGREEHTHTELCSSLGEDGKSLTITCGKEEHTHTDECWEIQPAAYTWSQDGLEITATFAPDAALPENATLVVERRTPDAPQPLDRMREMTATISRPIVSESAAPPVGSGLARSSEENEPAESNDTLREPDAEEQASLIPTDADPDDPSVGSGLARSSEESGTGTEPETASPVGSGLARSSEESGTGTEPETASPVGSGLARSSEENEPADSQQASLLTAEEDPPQQVMNTCIDYFRVYLAVDGVPVTPQAPADIQIQLQGQQYQDASNIELVQLTEDSDQTVLAQPDAAGTLTASFTGPLAGEYAVMALAADAPRATGTKPAASLTPSKTIEALPETNTYRLHLNAVAGASMEDTPMNMLLVLDRSGSMGFQMDTSGSSSKSRDAVLNEVVNGKEDYYGNKTLGLIYNFLNKNSQNRVAVVGFAGASNYSDGSQDASVLTNWTSNKSTSVNLGNGSGATNYCAAFVKADDMLTTIESQNSNPTIMVFLSDGRPTYYMDATGRHGPSNEEDPDKVTECIEKSGPYFDEYISNRHPNVTVYTVGMSTDIVGDGKDAILQEMADKGGGEYFGATSADQLQNAINQISAGKTYTGLKIEDKLSDYVDISAEPQYKVTKKLANGTTETVLYDGTLATPVTAEGTGIIQSVAYDAGTKTVTATFVPSYELEPGATYSLSYNVTVSQAAKVAYEADNTYGGTIGDPNTDYNPANVTSSGQAGFRSNQTATMSYKADGKDGSKTYPHPVVQVTVPSGPTAQPELNLTPHKTIDALREGADNPDTMLDDGLTEAEKTDLYRLYLDAEISPQTKPIDLLLVVDQSYSMNEAVNKDMQDYDQNYIGRDAAVNLVLNGANGGDGLITKFLNANSNNKLAIATFMSNTQAGDDSVNFGKSHTFNTDQDGNIILNGEAGILRHWTDTTQSVTVAGIYANATNYTAGFVQADALLNDPAVADDGNDKVMIFLSDGLPTAFIAYDESTGNYYRDGNGDDDGKGYGSNLTTAEATDAAFREFVGNHPNLLIHTVSLKAGAAESRLDGMKSPDVGYCYSVNDTNELRKALSKLMYGTAYTELKIGDTLSADVELCDQPDYKVTLTTPEGTVTTLYAGGKVTDQGKGILESVAYDSTSRKVTATFNPSYTPAPGNKVTLSFNVITSLHAYQTYKANNGYGDVKGDSGTDYTGNNTSSEQPGFYSNDYDKTQVSYKKYNETTTTTQNYPKPVIQVDPNKDQPTVPDTSNLKLTPHKTIDAFGDNTDNPDTTLDNTATDKSELYRLYLDAQVGPPVGMPMDLLLVVDESRSMRDYSIGNSDSTRRETALLNVLNGEGTEEGLISKFINMDAGNYIAVVGFNSTGGVRRGWGRNASDFVPDSGTYTNYCDAFTEAKQLLAEAKRDRRNNPKVMVFLSDGAPTAWYDERGRYRTTGLSYDPTDESIQRSKNYFDDLWQDNSDVKLITVNISSFESQVLPYMVEKSKGQYLTANSVDQLGQALESAAWGNAYNNVRIQDKLSAYVDVHPTQPDYKVTMKDAAGKETVLWPDNNGRGIIRNVSADGKTVTATFNPNYVLEPNCTYTLSYNVRVTDKAYEDFATGYNASGDSGTDYPGNATSSNQPGFRSNDTAKLIYKKDGVDGDKTYPHPVVQVNEEKDHDFTVRKQWLSYHGENITDTQTKVPSVEFKLFQHASGQVTVEPTTVWVTVYSKARGYSSQQLIRKQAAAGSTATLQFNINTSSFDNLKVGNSTVNLNPSSGRTYTHSFTVPSNDLSITINYSNAWAAPSSVSLNCPDPSPTLQDWSQKTELLNTGNGTWRAKTSEADVAEKWILSKENDWQAAVKNLPTSGKVSDGNGGTIDVTYSYTVEEVPVEGYDTNIVYKTDGSGESLKGSIIIQNKSTTPTYTLVLQKTNSEDSAKKPQGAKFDLYRKVTDGTGVTLKKPDGTNLDGTYILIDQPDNPADGSRPATDTNGLLTFKDLTAGDYCLVETYAPTGYHKRINPIPFNIDKDGNITYTGTETDITVKTDTIKVGSVSVNQPTITVPNKPWGKKLPNTGGAGTQPYTIGGMLILSLALLLLYEQKKRGKGDAVSS